VGVAPSTPQVSNGGHRSPGQGLFSRPAGLFDPRGEGSHWVAVIGMGWRPKRGARAVETSSRARNELGRVRGARRRATMPFGDHPDVLRGRALGVAADPAWGCPASPLGNPTPHVPSLIRQAHQKSGMPSAFRQSIPHRSAEHLRQRVSRISKCPRLAEVPESTLGAVLAVMYD
jgi:hypothetical protein